MIICFSNYEEMKVWEMEFNNIIKSLKISPDKITKEKYKQNQFLEKI